MKLALHAFPFALSAALLGTSLAGCAADTSADASADTSDASEEVAESEDALSGASSFGYFRVVRRDLRRCIAPLCGGFYVARVNQAKTQCADGSLQNDCYVSNIQLGGVGLSAREEADVRGKVESGSALIKAKTYKTKFNGVTIGVLKANEAWVGATGSTPNGTFYRIADNGIRCITAPCPSLSAYTLNDDDSHNLIKVDLASTATPADQASLDAATRALATKNGILIAGGIALPKCAVPNANCGPFATATELYLRVTRREGKSCGGFTAEGPVPCNAGQYCNYKPQDICGAADAPGRCAYKPELCNFILKPVCGCDGKTYSNDCLANGAGTSVSSMGACAN